MCRFFGRDYLRRDWKGRNFEDDGGKIRWIILNRFLIQPQTYNKKNRKSGKMNKRASLMNKRTGLSNIRILFGQNHNPFLAFSSPFFMSLTSNFVVFLPVGHFF